MIYRGLQELENKELIEHFEKEIGADMLKKIQIKVQEQLDPQREQLKKQLQRVVARFFRCHT